MRKYLIPILFILAITFIYAFRLSFPEKQYYDEVYHVKTAREFLALNGNTENTHPPFGKILIAAAIKILGDTSWAWRFFPCLAGLGAILVFQRLAKRALQSSEFAWLAAALFALDGISITQARIAMLNSLMLVFMLLAVLFFVRILEFSGTRKRDFIGCGLALGLAASTRWISVGVLPILTILLVKDFRKIQSKKDFSKYAFAFLFLLPLFIYIASHIILVFIKGYGWMGLWNYQLNMLHYHAQLKAGHNYGSPWWSWPLMTRPIWYLFERREGIVHGILCIGNPAMMWVLIPAMGYLIWRFVRYRCWTSGLIVAGFLLQWLPWAFIGRVKFFHYFYTAMPFLALAIAMVLRDAWKGGFEKRVAVAAYLALVVVMFLYWYPLLTGYPIREAYFQNHMWFRSWI